MNKKNLFIIFFAILSINNFFINIASSEYNKTILVTGGAGFIGSNFLKYMFNKYPNYKFIVLDKITYAGNLDNIPNYIKESPRYKLYQECITNEEVAKKIMKKVDWVVHFAAETHVEKSIYKNSDFFISNVIGTNVLINALLKSPNVERFIHISTSEVYGTAETEPMPETHPLNPRSPYAGAKTGADRLIYSYWCTFDIPITIIRPFNNYGPKQFPEKLIAKFVTNALNGEDLTVHGTGLAKRDWIYVTDNCRAIDKALHLKDFAKIKNQVINVGSGIATSVIDISKLILKELDLPESKLQFIEDRPGQVECHIADITKAKELLEWHPEVTLEEGIKKTIASYRKKLNKINTKK